MKKTLFSFLTLFLSAGFAQSNADQAQALVIESIECPAKTDRQCSELQNKYNIQAGQSIDSSKINTIKTYLSSSSRFESSNVFLKKGSRKNNVILVFDLKDKNNLTKSFRMGSRIRGSDISQRLGGRMAKHDLFGKGKILTLDVDGRVPFTKEASRSVYSRLQYIDPNLFKSKDFFLFGGLSFTNDTQKFDDNFTFKAQSLGIDLSLGKRFAKSRFISLGYHYNPYSKITDTINGVTNNYKLNQIIRISYGRDTKNDIHFATKGATFNTSVAWSPSNPNSFFDINIAYDVFWSKNNKNIWSFTIGGNPGTTFRPVLEDNINIAFGYARDTKQSSNKKFRWYIRAGVNDFTYTADYKTNISPSVKTGLKVKTKHFGVINLYILGTADWNL